MRAHHALAVVVVLVGGVLVKQFFFPATKAQADVVESASMNVLEMHRNLNMKDLPAQPIHDMTFSSD